MTDYLRTQATPAETSLLSRLLSANITNTSDNTSTSTENSAINTASKQGERFSVTNKYQGKKDTSAYAMDVAERLSDVGIDVKTLSSQEEARELAGEDAEYAKFKRLKNKKDNTEVYQKFLIFTDRKRDITSEIIKQKKQYNEYDYEVFIGIVNLNGDLYFYKNFDGQDFEVFATCNYGQYSEEVEKQIINVIKDGTVRNSKSLDKFIEGIEYKLGRYNSNNKGIRNERNLTNGDDSFRISEQTNERRDSDEGSEFTWYTNGEDDRIEFSTSDAIIYGFAEGNTITLTLEGINPNTPVHEYTHLWSKAVQKNNPALWQRCVDLAKATSVWEEVMNDPNYANIHQDEKKLPVIGTNPSILRGQVTTYRKVYDTKMDVFFEKSKENSERINKVLSINTPYQFHNAQVSDIEIAKATESSITTPGYGPGNRTSQLPIDAKLQNIFSLAPKIAVNSAINTDSKQGEHSSITNKQVDTKDNEDDAKIRDHVRFSLSPTPKTIDEVNDALDNLTTKRIPTTSETTRITNEIAANRILDDLRDIEIDRLRRPSESNSFIERTKSKLKSPLITFNTSMKRLGLNSPDGKGSAWNYFMNKWDEARNLEIERSHEISAIMESAARTIVDGGVSALVKIGNTPAGVVALSVKKISKKMRFLLCIQKNVLLLHCQR